jgi:hypothetical protein
MQLVLCATGSDECGRFPLSVRCGKKKARTRLGISISSRAPHGDNPDDTLHTEGALLGLDEERRGAEPHDEKERASKRRRLPSTRCLSAVEVAQ